MTGSGNARTIDAGSVTFAALKRRLYGLAFIDEFGPVYAVYTLWFNDNGISTAQVSTVFVAWAIIALALEIPSGALADRLDRRRLLGAAFTIRGAGIGLWLVWPTFTGVLIGAALWAIHDSLASGAWEAMIHDELDAVGRAPAYAQVMARIGQFSHLGIAASTLLGAALLQVDVNLETLGWLTLIAHVGSIALVVTLPDARRRPGRAHGSTATSTTTSTTTPATTPATTPTTTPTTPPPTRPIARSVRARSPRRPLPTPAPTARSRIGPGGRRCAPASATQAPTRYSPASSSWAPCSKGSSSSTNTSR